jgi:hypothetical protein
MLLFVVLLFNDFIIHYGKESLFVKRKLTGQDTYYEWTIVRVHPFIPSPLRERVRVRV